jgi:hypothetical protein
MRNLVFTQLYYINTLTIPTCFDPCGIIIRETVYQMISLPFYDDPTGNETCKSFFMI